MFNTQLIDAQPIIYRFKIGKIDCSLIGLDLFTNDLLPLKRCIVNSSFGWYINSKFYSYKKIVKIYEKKQ